MNDVCFLYAHDGQQMHGRCAGGWILARHAWRCERLCNGILDINLVQHVCWWPVCCLVGVGCTKTLRDADIVLELGRVELNGKCHCLGVTPGAHGGQC